MSARLRSLLLLAVVAVCAVAACSSEGPAGGPATGAADTHCVAPDGGQIVQDTSPSECHPADAGAQAPDYGETNYNTSAADDDCKYDVQFTVTAVRQDENATFVVKAISRADGSAVTGANARAEIYLSSTHPAPNVGTSTVESPPGTYTISPVQFDAAGRWTTRFHFFESCADDTEESPHGHAAFYIDVP